MSFFKYLKHIKDVLERECPVRCFDILVLSARNGIVTIRSPWFCMASNAALVGRRNFHIHPP
ncbi:Peroxidase 21 [Platanthera guangdongensis]|uniref:Peroxidase 21 n=1 Tax=Platanthera guangdongensis TaxID=2320717 RepID=A0ABR2LTM0_9ASPA